MTAASETAARPRRSAAGRIRVLMVEDTRSDAEMIRGYLAAAGPSRFDLTHVPTLGDGLRRLGRSGVDTLLLDLNLPDSSGLGTALKAREAAPDVPIIILSGFEERALAVQAVQQGAQDYIVKADIDARLLERSIRYAIERQRLLSEAAHRYQRELELGQLKTKLVSMVSHEFANALSVIECALPLLKETAGEPDEARRPIYEALESNVRSLHVTAHNLLNLGRLEAGKLTLNFRSTEAVALVKDCLRTLEMLCRRKNIEPSFEGTEGPLHARAEPESLSLVVCNLISNAIKYTPDGGKLRVGVGPDPADPRRALIYVEDTGIGIGKAEQKKVLGGNYRTEQGQRTAKGFGVGILFARTILDAHGAELKVRSSPGKGSRFYFSVPLWEGRAAAPH